MDNKLKVTPIDWKKCLSLWWPILGGLSVLYLPTFFHLANGLWNEEGNVHGPIILCLSLWLIMRKWRRTTEVTSLTVRSIVIGSIIFVCGLILYIIGRSQSIPIFEITSFVVVSAAIILIMQGTKAIKALWFPFFFMLFIIPLPGTIVNVLTMPMKVAVSYVTEHILFFAGYPIARNGVILSIGQYQLLVADACAGLQTLLTLEALGLFYLNIAHHASAFRNILLGIMIIPISFSANVIRVTILTLITYHFGDEAGQGFLHGFAGMVLFLSALLLIISVDSMLKLLVRNFENNKLRVIHQ